MVVTPGATSVPALIRRSRGLANFRFARVTSGFSAGDTLAVSSGAFQNLTSVSLATNSAEGNSSDSFTVRESLRDLGLDDRLIYLAIVGEIKHLREHQHPTL